ncbi:universal stress protein [Salinigranum sp. GCM10025319]|uniref:universal stress protein n=1 Tax=Salinigranum sp. GCM10025319 TaxID=3252687 RepID=UPI00360C1B0A
MDSVTLFRCCYIQGAYRSVNRHRNIHLVVMGARERRGLDWFLTHTTAERVVRTATVPSVCSASSYLRYCPERLVSPRPVAWILPKVLAGVPTLSHYGRYDRRRGDGTVRTE